MSSTPHSHLPALPRATSGASAQVEWEKAARQLLEEGQAFLAHDLAKSGLTAFPESVKLHQTAALALIRAGALQEARSLLETLAPTLSPDRENLKSIYYDLRTMIQLAVSPAGAEATPAALDTLAGLLQKVGQMSARTHHFAEPDEETLGLLARVHKGLWMQSGQVAEARFARDAYLRSYRSTRGYWTGINAATMSWILEEKELAAQIAQEVLRQCEIQMVMGQTDYWLLATQGEACLLLGQEEEAVAAYRQAVQSAGHKYANIVSSLQQLRLLQEHGFPVPDRLLEILKPPQIVVFVGHMIDHPERAEPRFPSGLETLVREEIEQKLEDLDARIGYCSAACGSDLLFIEAMQARGAEINIVLPFAKEDFIQHCVRFAGPRWVTRFENALKLANSVRYVTEEPLLDDHILFDFTAQIFIGYADIHARTLQTRPVLLSVWDESVDGPAGGTADIVSRWPAGQPHITISTRRLLASAPQFAGIRAGLSVTSQTPALSTSSSGSRRIQTMLFADLVGYSSLQERQLPAFINRFMTTVAAEMKTTPQFINTWGDAIFAVIENALPMTEYALSLQRVICENIWPDFGLSENMSVRIGLHAGPVFEGIDALTRRVNFYGAHVNRAARLEPVTVPGHIYASEQFVALLAAEQSLDKQTVSFVGQAGSYRFACDPVGTLSLAKNFGSQNTYHIRRIG